MLVEHAKSGWIPVRYRPNATSIGRSLGRKLVTTDMHNDVMASCLYECEPACLAINIIDKDETHKVTGGIYVAWYFRFLGVFQQIPSVSECA